MGAMDPVVTGQLGPGHPFARHVSDFLTDLSNANASAHTLRAYRGDLLQFAAYHDGEVGELTAATVRAYLADIAGLAASGRKRKRAAVASFCRWAVRHDLLHANPMDKIDSIRVPKRLPRPAAAADVTRVLAVICSRRPARICRWTGCCSRPRTCAAPAPPRSAGSTSGISTSCPRSRAGSGRTGTHAKDPAHPRPDTAR
jgi:integrase/recombinase XerD